MAILLNFRWSGLNMMGEALDGRLIGGNSVHIRWIQTLIEHQIKPLCIRLDAEHLLAVPNREQAGPSTCPY